MIGCSICTVLEPNIIDILDNRLFHWQCFTKYVQCIWKCWSTDYLNHVQQCGKWQFKKENIKIGTQKKKKFHFENELLLELLR